MNWFEKYKQDCFDVYYQKNEDNYQQDKVEIILNKIEKQKLKKETIEYIITNSDKIKSNIANIDTIKSGDFWLDVNIYSNKIKIFNLRNLAEKLNHVSKQKFYVFDYKDGQKIIKEKLNGNVLLDPDELISFLNYLYKIKEWAIFL